MVFNRKCIANDFYEYLWQKKYGVWTLRECSLKAFYLVTNKLMTDKNIFI